MKKSKKLLSCLLAVSMVLGQVLILFPVKAEAASYQLWVGSVQVTDDNSADILGDGKVSYDPGKNVLTLNGATIDKLTDSFSDSFGNGSYAMIRSEGDLKIKVLNECDLDASKSDVQKSNRFGIYCRGDLTIGGSGTLNVINGTSTNPSYGDFRANVALWSVGTLTFKDSVAVNLYGGTGEAESAGLCSHEEVYLNDTVQVKAVGGTSNFSYGSGEKRSYGTWLMYGNKSININGGSFITSGNNHSLLNGRVIVDGGTIFVGDDAESATKHDSETYLAADSAPLYLSAAVTTIKSVTNIWIGSNDTLMDVVDTKCTYWKDNGNNSGIVETTEDATGDDAWVVAFIPATDKRLAVLKLRNFNYIGDGNWRSIDPQTSGAITVAGPRLTIEFEGKNYIRSTGGASYYKHAFRGEGTDMTFMGTDDAELTLIAGPGATPYTNALCTRDFVLDGGTLICDGTYNNASYNGLWCNNGTISVLSGTLEGLGAKPIWGENELAEGDVIVDTEAKKVITGVNCEVNVSAGTTMTKTTDSGSSHQVAGKGTKIVPIIYTVSDGHCFPVDYSIKAVNGITVTRDSYTQITVSGAPSDNVDLALPDAPLRRKFTVSYNAGEGEGTMESQTAVEGELFKLPENGFTSDKLAFDKWQVNGKEYPEGESLYIDADTAITAIWKTIPPQTPVAATVTSGGLVCDGTDKPLLTISGKTTGGTMYYALGTDATSAPSSSWSTAVPTGNGAGTYYVWYKVVADEGYTDTEPACITVTIAEEPLKSKAEKAKKNNKATISDNIMIVPDAAGKVWTLDAALADASSNEIALKVTFTSGAKVKLNGYDKKESKKYKDANKASKKTATISTKGILKAKKEGAGTLKYAIADGKTVTIEYTVVKPAIVVADGKDASVNSVAPGSVKKLKAAYTAAGGFDVKLTGVPLNSLYTFKGKKVLSEQNIVIGEDGALHITGELEARKTSKVIINAQGKKYTVLITGKFR
ncbi:MAG: hypothetical protein K5987_01005 [Lachnospiraceae bacterium]|nr:hypothetical protein [Lachnospiraceae bacterium]